MYHTGKLLLTSRWGSRFDPATKKINHVISCLWNHHSGKWIDIDWWGPRFEALVLTIFIDWWPYFEQTITKCQFVMISSFNLWRFMMQHRTWRHYVMISLSNKLSQNINLWWFLLLICDSLWCGIGPEDIMWRFLISQNSICDGRWCYRHKNVA
jgi:hypothetical protein